MIIKESCYMSKKLQTNNELQKNIEIQHKRHKRWCPFVSLVLLVFFCAV